MRPTRAEVLLMLVVIAAMILLVLRQPHSVQDSPVVISHSPWREVVLEEQVEQPIFTSETATDLRLEIDVAGRLGDGTIRVTTIPSTSDDFVVGTRGTTNRSLAKTKEIALTYHRLDPASPAKMTLKYRLDLQ